MARPCCCGYLLLLLVFWIILVLVCLGVLFGFQFIISVIQVKYVGLGCTAVEPVFVDYCVWCLVWCYLLVVGGVDVGVFCLPC